jgi:hypothetical protein
MKVHFQVLYPRGASMRCGIDLPEPPTYAAVRDVARVLMGNRVPVRLPIWREDGEEVALLVDHHPGDHNTKATAILRDSLHRRAAVPLDCLDQHMVSGIAILVEPKAWP